MAEPRTLIAKSRQGSGTGAARAVRREGRVPAIVYGGKGEPQNVSLDPKEMWAIVQTGRFTSTLIELAMDGKKQRVLPREVQIDPVTDKLVHADFMRLEPGARVRLDVPVRFKNHDGSPGLKRGGVLNIVRHEVAFYCPVDAIPEFIEGDLTDLEINDSIHISAFKLPKGAELVIKNRDFTVATIVPPSGFGEDLEAKPAAGAKPGAAPAKGEKK